MSEESKPVRAYVWGVYLIDGHDGQHGCLRLYADRRLAERYVIHVLKRNRYFPKFYKRMPKRKRKATTWGGFGEGHLYTEYYVARARVY